MTVRPRAWQTLCEPKCGKPIKITVWKNREYNQAGQELTLHPKELRSWNAVLNFFTMSLQPRWGAVRRLYHLDSKQLVQCFKDIKPNEKYVVVGTEKFKYKKNGYLTEEEPPEASTSELDLEDFMVYTKKKRRTVVYFMVSGRACQPPIKVVLIERDLLDYAMVLEYLAHRLDVGEGIHSLCSVDGKTVGKLEELKHGEMYVAIPYGFGFIKMDYAALFAEATSSKNQRKVRKRKKQVGAKKTYQQNDQEPLQALLQGHQCVLEKCKSSDCSGKSIKEEIDWDGELQDQLEGIVTDVDIIRQLLDDIVDHTMLQAKRNSIPTPNNVNQSQTSQDVMEEQQLTHAQDDNDDQNRTYEVMNHAQDDDNDDQNKTDEPQDSMIFDYRDSSQPEQEDADVSSTSTAQQFTDDDEKRLSQDQSTTVEDQSDKTTGKNLTTFAELARNREVDVEPVFAFDAPKTRPRESYGSKCSITGKRSVAFVPASKTVRNSAQAPLTSEEQQPGADETLQSLSNLKMQAATHNLMSHEARDSTYVSEYSSSSDNDSLESFGWSEKAVQKPWGVEEGNEDKELQTVITSISAAGFVAPDDLDLAHIFINDDKENYSIAPSVFIPKSSDDVSSESSIMRDSTWRCRRERCVTFACSDICIEECPGDESCDQ